MDQKRLRTLAGIKTNTQTELLESVITEPNPNDLWNPEVLVQGVGRYSLKSLKQNVRNKLKDMYETVSSDDPEQWDSAAAKLKHDAMHAMMETIKAAHEELRKK